MSIWDICQYLKEICFFEFDKGNLVAKREVDNTKDFNPEDPVGWGKIEKSLYEQWLKNSNKGSPTKS